MFHSVTLLASILIVSNHVNDIVLLDSLNHFLIWASRHSSLSVSGSRSMPQCVVNRDSSKSRSNWICFLPLLLESAMYALKVDIRVPGSKPAT
jgi:hypothetical protein